MRLNRSLLFPVLVPVGTVLVVLLLVELGLRLFYPVPFSIEKNMYFMPDPHTGFRLRPNSTGNFHRDIEARANAHGHRDTYVPLERTPGVARILVLGDSFTVGASVEEEEAWPQVLERLLNRGDRRVEVVNSGTGGWNPLQYAQYYEHYGQAFNPDHVVLGYFVGNDTYDRTSNVQGLKTAVLGRRLSRDKAESPFVRLRVLLNTQSHLARLLRPPGPVMEDFTREHCGDFGDYYAMVQKQRLYNHQRRTPQREERAANGIAQVERIRELARAQGAGFTLVLIPDENQINPQLRAAIIDEGERDKYDFAMPQSMLNELFAARGIEVIDLLPLFLKDDRCLYLNDTHWTAEGHVLAAETIAARLEGAVQRAGPGD